MILEVVGWAIGFFLICSAVCMVVSWWVDQG
jgi:hypothetical protein